MGACDKADMSQKVMCCAGKVQLIVLAGIFIFFAMASAGCTYWQMGDMKKVMESANAKEPDPEKKINPDYMYVLFALPGFMFLSALCLFAALKLNPKMLLVICIAWPVITCAIPGLCIWWSVKYYTELDAVVKKYGKNAFEATNEAEFYMVYVVAGGSAIHILASIYCIMLLVCLGCCQRAGAGKEKDLYSLESETRDDSELSSSKSHISFE